MRIKKEISDFYILADCCNDEVELIGVLILLLDLNPTQKMINELQTYKLKNHSDNINLILDNLTIRTIREIINIRNLKKDSINKLII